MKENQCKITGDSPSPMSQDMSAMAVAFIEILDLLNEEDLIRLGHRARKRRYDVAMKYLDTTLADRRGSKSESHPH